MAAGSAMATPTLTVTAGASAARSATLRSMAPVVPDPKRIKTFTSQQAFEAWLATHHDSEPELWLKIHKKDSGLPSVTAAQALDVVLCWGWIDGIRKSFDERSFLQRYTPRRPRSVWSQVNRDHVARLTAAGRMTPHGQKQVDAAKADGRWDAAYAPIRSASRETVPADLRAAIDANPRARKTFRDARALQPVRADVSHQQHEDPGRPRREDRDAGGDAGARRDHRAGAATRHTNAALSARSALTRRSSSAVVL